MESCPISQITSVTQSCPTLCDPMDCSMPDLPVHHQLLEFTQKLMSIESMMPSICRLISSHFQSFPKSGSFSSESVLHNRWPKDRSFSCNISPSNEYSGLISIRMTACIFSQSNWLSRGFNRTVQKHTFFTAQLSLYSNSHIQT